MTNAVIVSTARTPLAKSWKGAFNMTHGATLGGHAVQHAVQRAGIEAAEVDDVIMGCATPEGATGDIHITFARNNALRRHRDGLQAAGAEAVHGSTAHRGRQAGTQRGLARDIPAGRTFGVGAAHQHIFDRAGVDAGTLHRGLDGKAAQRGAVRHVEGTFPALGQGCAGGGHDDGSAHGKSSCRKWGWLLGGLFDQPVVEADQLGQVGQ